MFCIVFRFFHFVVNQAVDAERLGNVGQHGLAGFFQVFLGQMAGGRVAALHFNGAGGAAADFLYLHTAAAAVFKINRFVVFAGLGDEFHGDMAALACRGVAGFHRHAAAQNLNGNGASAACGQLAVESPAVLAAGCLAGVVAFGHAEAEVFGDAAEGGGGVAPTVARRYHNGVGFWGAVGVFVGDGGKIVAAVNAQACVFLRLVVARRGVAAGFGRGFVKQVIRVAEDFFVGIYGLQHGVVAGREQRQREQADGEGFSHGIIFKCLFLKYFQI